MASGSRFQQIYAETKRISTSSSGGKTMPFKVDLVTSGHL